MMMVIVMMMVITLNIMVMVLITLDMMRFRPDVCMKVAFLSSVAEEFFLLLQKVCTCGSLLLLGWLSHFDYSPSHNWSYGREKLRYTTTLKKLF